MFVVPQSVIAINKPHNRLRGGSPVRAIRSKYSPSRRKVNKLFTAAVPHDVTLSRLDSKLVPHLDSKNLVTEGIGCHEHSSANSQRRHCCMTSSKRNVINAKALESLQAPIEIPVPVVIDWKCGMMSSICCSIFYRGMTLTRPVCDRKL